MRKYTLFEGELLDGSINEVIPGLIESAKLKNEDVFLRWNGVTVRIMPESSPESVYECYKNQLHKEDLLAKECTGELVSYKELGEKIARYLKEL